MTPEEIILALLSETIEDYFYRVEDSWSPFDQAMNNTVSNELRVVREKFRRKLKEIKDNET